MPGALQIKDAVDDVAPAPGVVLYGGYTNDISPTIEISLGDRAVAGETLTLSANGVVLGSLQLAAADVASGVASIQAHDLAAGWNLLSATLSDAQGQELASSNPWALGVSTTTPAAPVIIGATDAGASLTNCGEAPDGAIMLQLTEAGLATAPSGPPGHPPYGGPALQGGDLLIYDGKTLIADAKLGYDGVIEISPTNPLSPGRHELTAVAVDRAGDASAASQPFVVDVAGGPASAPGVSSVLQASASAPQVLGGASDETIAGWSGADVLHGGGGADSITGGADFNDINGNQGADTIVGASRVGDWLLGGQGADSISATASQGHNLVFGNMGEDTLAGGAGGDSLRGGQGDDQVMGGSGADWISGDLGHNTLSGGAGADTFHGSPGIDRVTDFNAGAGDRVQVDAGLTYSLSQDGADTVIALSNGGRLTLAGVSSASLAGGWIVQA